jgi:protein disulfide-isomerase
MSRQATHLSLIWCIVLTVLNLGQLSGDTAAQQAGLGPSGQSSGIQWQHDLETAKATAKQTGRLVLVHFWMPTCTPCLMLEDTVFNQPGVDAALRAQFVPVKLNANEHPEIAQAFGITRLPMDVILTADGHVVGKHISPPTPVAYIAELTQLARHYATRSGGAFAQSAGAATAPSTLNAAYAGLRIPANTPPALDARAANSNQNPFIAAKGPASTFSAAQATPSAAIAGSFSPPALAPEQLMPPDPYGPLQPVSSEIPVSPAPQQVANPYASLSSSAAPQQVANPYPASSSSAVPQPVANPYVTSPSSGAGLSPPSTAAPDPRALPSNAPPLGFDGYCPVSMRTHWKWVPGDPRWGIVHRGRTYWFAGQAEQQQFWANPDRYSPALSGMDPVLAIDHGQQVPGKREHSIDYDNLFYMFASEATLQQFTATPERYAVTVRQAMGIQRGRLVR